VKKTFSEKFYEVLRVQDDGEIEGCVSMPKERFLSILDEEIINYGKDTQAEIGMGIYKLVEQKKKENIGVEEILEMVINLCKGLIANSPESAMEFSSRLEGRCGAK